MTDIKKIDFDSVARNIYSKYGGIDHGDFYQIHCPCSDHNDDKPSCSVRSVGDKLLVHCQVCDSEPGSHRAYSALIEAGDLPQTRKPYFQVLWDEANTDTVYFETYLEGRGIYDVSMPKSVRVHDNLKHRETGEEHVALIAAITNVNEQLVAVHRTYMNDAQDGKIENVEAKMMVGKSRGGHVNLHQGIDTLHIAEGLETTFAVWKNLSDLETDSFWATLSAANFANVEVPSGTYSSVHLWADLDKSGAGENAARKLAGRLYAENITVYIHLPKEDLGSRKSIDWLDVQEKIHDSYSDSIEYTPTKWEADNAESPEGYVLDKNGVVKLKASKDDGECQRILISRHPIWVSSRCRMLDDDTARCVITYFDTNYSDYRSCIISTAALTSTRLFHEEFFRRTCFSIDHKLLSLLCSYLYHSYEVCTNIRYCSRLSGWFTIDGMKRFALFDEDIEILADEGSAESFAAFRTRGSIEGWKRDVLSNVVKCYGASFIFAAGLAAPLFSLFDFNSIPVTMAAGSGDGKSVSAYAALSAWCHPKEIEMSGSSSIAGMKSILTALRDVPSLIDEVQLKGTEKLSDLIYDIGNSGKSQKANRDGSARKVARIRTTSFFTGERSMSDCVRYEGGNVRMIQLREMDLLAELRHDEQLIDSLRLGSFKHFGHFAPLYIRRLTDLYNSGELEMILRQYEGTLKSGDRTQNRQRERYAAMLTGCSVLGEILGEKFSQPLMAAVYKHWSEAVEDREPQSIANRALETLTDFVISNGHLFGESMTDDIKTTPWGEWQDDGSFAILNESLKQVLKDFDLTEVKRHWKRKEWLNISESALSRKRYTNTARIGSRAKATCLLLTREAVEGMLPEHMKNYTGADKQEVS